MTTSTEDHVPTTPNPRIAVLLSSRNKDRIPNGKGAAVKLADVRKRLQSELNQLEIFGHPVLEVWINETAGAESGDQDTWDHCMEEVDRADVMIVIYNGEAGWGTDTGEVGICHAEMRRALDRAPSKLRVIALSFDSDPKLELISPDVAARRNASNLSFQKEVAGFFNDMAEDAASLERAVQLAVVKAVVDLAKTGSEEGRRGRYHLGAPLDWSRLSYPDRKQEMEQVVRRYLTGVRKAVGPVDSPEPLRLSLAGQKVLVSTYAVPAGFGIAEARELVGRPYLRDHKLPFTELNGAVGPVHVIACHKNCTESQINSFMGHPDVFVVQAPFGFFVADLVSFVQTFFLVSCRDETSTRVALRRMFDWIEQSGELSRIVARGRSRRAILEAIAKQIRQHAGVAARAPGAPGPRALPPAPPPRPVPKAPPPP